VQPQRSAIGSARARVSPLCRLGVKATAYALAGGVILAGLAHVPLVLCRGSDSISLISCSGWKLAVAWCDEPQVCYWANSEFAPFGRNQPSLAVCVGWARYVFTRNPPLSKILTALESPDSADVVDALWCLTRIPDKRARERVVPLLDDDRVTIRILAAAVLWRMGDASGLWVLEKDAASSNTAVAGLARAVLSGIRRPRR